MASPLEITGDDLQLWSKRVDAAHTLPDLVRRLLLATMPISAVTSLDMRADGGTRLGGWDGVVHSNRSSPFCPSGTSVWELSVQQDIQRKLDKDYEKRSRQPAPPIRQAGEASYIVVTAGRFTDKQVWAEKRRRTGTWRDVRVLDADDLATWLSQAPAVARWFALKLGKPLDEASNVETLLQAWSARTRPPLPIELLLAGRERERSAASVLEWAQAAHPTLLYIRGDTKDEALAFAAAAFQLVPERELWSARILIVESQRALRWALRTVTAEPLVLLPAFEDFDPKLVDRPAFVVVPLDSRAPLASSRVLDLPPAPYRRFAEILVTAGVEREVAERRAMESGGKLTALQRLFGYVVPPSWAAQANPMQLGTLLLVGAWQPTNEADSNVLRLLGVDARDVEALCERLSLIADAATVRDRDHWEQATWTFRAPGDVWQALAGTLPAELLRRFESTVQTVLGKPDPRFELKNDERFSAAIFGKVLRESKAIREGLSNSLARLSQSDELLMPLHGPRRGSALAARVVHELLEPDWIRWASVAPFLPQLAEAAPEAFLDRLEESLRKGEEGVAHLLAEEGQFSSPHTGLLWALETLGWSAERMPRVAIALAKLAEFDKRLERPGRLSNRPAASLGNLFDVEFPQTTATLESQLAALQLLLKEAPDVTFDLLMRQLDPLSGGGFTSPSRRPALASWALPTDDDLRRHGPDAVAYTERIISLALQHADSNAQHWARLIKTSRHLPEKNDFLVLERLDEVRNQIRDTEGALWSALRDRIRLSLPEESKPPRRLNTHQKARQLYESFTPEDLALRSAWLFEPDVQLPELPLGTPRKIYTEKLQQLRDDALRTIWSQDNRWSLIQDILTRVKSPHNLGRALGMSEFSDEVETHLLNADADLTYEQLTVPFLSGRWVHLEQSDDWLKSVIQRLVKNGRSAQAIELGHRLPQILSIWAAFDSLGEPVSSDYWRTHDHIFGERSPADWEYAIGRLLSAGNIAVALDYTAHAIEHLSDETITNVLRAFVESPEEQKRFFKIRQAASYALETILARIEGSSAAKPDLLAHVELIYCLTTYEPTRPTKHLSAMFGGDPEQFVALIKTLYRRRDEQEEQGKEDSNPSEDREHRVVNGYRLLAAWKGYPGEGSPNAEREGALQNWSRHVLRRTAEEGRAEVGSSEVAKVLARAPVAVDGHWPCQAARQLLESGEFPFLSDSLSTAKRNLRGGTSRSLGEGGKQERELAAVFAASANILRLGWPRTAVLLDELAQGYEHEAAMHDESAKATLRREGAEPEDFVRSSMRQPRPAAPGAPSQSIAEGIVHIESISLKDFCAFEDLTLTLKPPSGSRGQWLVLLGENGMGKSSILRAIVLALGGTNVASAAIATHQGPLIRMNTKRATCTVDCGGTRFERSLVDELTGVVASSEPNGPSSRPLIFAYGCRRGSALSGTDSGSTDTQFSDVATLFDESARISSALHWLKKFRLNAIDKSGVHMGIYETVTRKLCELLVDVEKIEVHGEDVWAIAPKLGGKIPLAGLSDGYLTTIGWAVDLIARWLAWAERLGLDVSGDFFARMEGLVLLDEIDMHLHPRWQRDVVQMLKAVFPRMSFVATTHNPLTLLGTEPGEIHVLRWSEEAHRIEAKPLDFPRGLRADQILTGEWFGLESTLDDETLKLLENHRTMLLNSVPADAPERLALEANLRERLGTFSDTALDRMALNVAAELMMEQQQARSAEERESLRNQMKERLKAKLSERSNSPD